MQTHHHMAPPTHHTSLTQLVKVSVWSVVMYRVTSLIQQMIPPIFFFSIRERRHVKSRDPCFPLPILKYQGFSIIVSISQRQTASSSSSMTFTKYVYTYLYSCVYDSTTTVLQRDTCSISLCLYREAEFCSYISPETSD